MVKNLLCNAGDAGSIPGEGIKIPSAVWQLSLHATTRLSNNNKAGHRGGWSAGRSSIQPESSSVPAGITGTQKCPVWSLLLYHPHTLCKVLGTY